MKTLLTTLLLTATLAATAQHNLALRRAAWASSAYDYNLTAQLATDGIADDATPALLRVSTPDGTLPRREREWTLDGNEWSHNVVTGDDTWLLYQWEGMAPIEATRVVVTARLAHHEDGHGYTISCETSADGRHWTAATATGTDLPGRPLRYRVQADPNKQTDADLLPARSVVQELVLPRGGRRFTQLRLRLKAGGAAYWNVYSLQLFAAGGREVEALPSQQFSSLWMSDGGGRQWLSIDLGTPSRIDSVVPHWLEQPRRWHSEVEADGARLRLVMDEPGPSGCYALREVEVFGEHRTPLSAQPVGSAPSAWRLQRASEVLGTGEQISQADFDDSAWPTATVPGTVLTSYINIGAVPNPDFADNMEQISESFFRSNFWYRGLLHVDDPQGQQLLCFDGINWKAHVFLNGHRLGRIEGAFQRAQFNVSGLLQRGRNVVAVEVVCNDHFGSIKEKDANTTQFNGGILGADNPTFHASVGWDWITTIRGREAGIWNSVSLKRLAGSVVLSDPYVATTVDSVSGRVAVSAAVFVRNLSAVAVSGTLRGWLGDVVFEQPVMVAAGQEQEVTFAAADYPQLCRTDFRLWWPNGYGEPFRYEAGFAFGDEQLHFRAGLRQMDYVDADDSLRIYVNGRRFVPLGGNWGFPEHNLRYTKRDYDAAVGYHRDMHCTMIRNWVGQTGHRAFYDACDSLGIMVWQDFWLANPADGPDPLDEQMFLSNASDYVRRIRQHPSIALYCGRNEGFPPPTIDRALRRYVATLSPGLGYISSSADGGVTGHGPYSAQPARTYFERQTGKLHTERGMPAVMNIESLRRTFSTDSLWPQSVQWGQHDYTLHGAQRASEFNALVDSAFGPSASAEQFARRAQLVNYDGYRAMFESGSRTRSGLLIWMSHACWPSLVWQTYDYFFDPTAAYFGTKKGCEPLHIQLNALTDSVEVVNISQPLQPRLTATATFYDVATGRRLSSQRATLRCPTDTTLAVLHIDRPAGSALLRLQLSDKRGPLSVNDYLLPAADGDYRQLSALPAPQLRHSLTVTKADGSPASPSDGLSPDVRLTATIHLHNAGGTMAPFVRLSLLDAYGTPILPALYSDNYVTLLPGEHRTITVSYRAADGTLAPRLSLTSLAEH